MKTLLAPEITVLLARGPPVSAAVQAGASITRPHALRANAVALPRALQPDPPIASRVVSPRVKPKPPTADPPALQGGKPAPVGGYDGAARLCESLADVKQGSCCLDRAVRHFPVGPPG